MSDGDAVLEIDGKSRRELLEERHKLQTDLSKNLSDIVLREEKPAAATKAKLGELKKLLNDSQWKRLEDLVTRTKLWDSVNTIPHFKSFLYSARLQEVFRKLLTKTTESFLFLTLIIERFNADNERVGQNCEAPVHYAVRQLNGQFLSWLLNNRKTTIDVNLRNANKETALYILCKSFDEYMRKPHDNTTKYKLQKIKRLIEKLLDAGADFNICNLRRVLPFELLLINRQTKKSTKKFVDWCVRKTAQPLATITSPDSKTGERIVEFYISPEQPAVKPSLDLPVEVTAELLEICLRNNDQQSFLLFLSNFEISGDNVNKVIEVVLHTAVQQKLSKCMRKTIHVGGGLIFEDINQKKDDKPVEMKFRVELKGLLKKACLVGELSIVKMLMCKIKDSQLINEALVLAFILNKAGKLEPERRKALLTVACYLATNNEIDVYKPDNSGNTPLHLAVKYGFHEIVIALLNKHNVYVGVRNRDGLTPLDYGGLESWRNYLESCIGEGSKRSAQNNSILQFNIKCLQPFNTQYQGKKSRQASNMQQKPQNHIAVQTEMTAIRQIAESKKLKPLLLHVIISTYIKMKWNLLSEVLAMHVLANVIAWWVFMLPSNWSHGSQWLKIGEICAMLIIAGREIVLFFILRTSYFSFVNMMDIWIIVVMCMIMWQWYSYKALIIWHIIMVAQFVHLWSIVHETVWNVIISLKVRLLQFLKVFVYFVVLIYVALFYYVLCDNSLLSQGDESGFANNNDTANRFNDFGTFWTAFVKIFMAQGGFWKGVALALDNLSLFIRPVIISALTFLLKFIYDYTNCVKSMTCGELMFSRVSNIVVHMERYEWLFTNTLLANVIQRYAFHFLRCNDRIFIEKSGKIFVDKYEQSVIPCLGENLKHKKLRSRPVPERECHINLGCWQYTKVLSLKPAVMDEALAVIKRRCNNRQLKKKGRTNHLVDITAVNNAIRRLRGLLDRCSLDEWQEIRAKHKLSEHENVMQLQQLPTMD